MRNPGYGHQNKKARSRDRAFLFCQLKQVAQIVSDTSASLSMSSVPIR